MFSGKRIWAPYDNAMSGINGHFGMERRPGPFMFPSEIILYIWMSKGIETEHVSYVA